MMGTRYTEGGLEATGLVQVRLQGEGGKSTKARKKVREEKRDGRGGEDKNLKVMDKDLDQRENIHSSKKYWFPPHQPPNIEGEKRYSKRREGHKRKKISAGCRFGWIHNKNPGKGGKGREGRGKVDGLKGQRYTTEPKKNKFPRGGSKQESAQNPDRKPSLKQEREKIGWGAGLKGQRTYYFNCARHEARK